MRLERPTFQDISELLKLMSFWDLIEQYDYKVDLDEFVGTDQYPYMAEFCLKEGETKEEARLKFFQYLKGYIWRIQLITMAADTLIRYTCDLDQNFLDYHPTIKQYLEENDITINPTS